MEVDYDGSIPANTTEAGGSKNASFIGRGTRMIETLNAIEFARVVSSGRTQPIVVIGEDANGASIEVHAKLSSGCDLGVTSLAREVIAAQLAADLGLPVPRPFLIRLSPQWIETIPDNQLREKISAGSSLASASESLRGYSTWGIGNRISAPMAPTAAAIFVFDGIIQNVDRRSGNSNCLVKGEQIRIIDHEIAFGHEGVFGWIPPWKPGGLQFLMNPPHTHIFGSGLRRKSLDLAPVREAWTGLSEAHLREYEGAIPPEWSSASAGVKGAITLIREARDNIDGCMAEVVRVLK